TAAGLAVASAQAGQRTLIVDADFGRPSQAARFAVDGTVGLRQVLANKIPFEAAIQATEVPGLFVLPAGEANGAGAVLDASVLPTLLQELANRWDRVLVDSPALLQAVDARILAAVCDASLLVLRPGSSTVSAVQAAEEAVASVGGQIVGVVFRSAGSSTVRSGRLHSAELLALPHPPTHSPRGADDRRVGEQA
ncbi:MAG: CpsD/CapB family tyrosine-protein kinase, partial [Planctomycetota bacterium]